VDRRPQKTSLVKFEYAGAYVVLRCAMCVDDAVVTIYATKTFRLFSTHIDSFAFGLRTLMRTRGRAGNFHQLTTSTGLVRRLTRQNKGHDLDKIATSRRWALFSSTQERDLDLHNLLSLQERTLSQNLVTT
jgi:hypothetical protein